MNWAITTRIGVAVGSIDVSSLDNALFSVYFLDYDAEVE